MKVVHRSSGRTVIIRNGLEDSAQRGTVSQEEAEKQLRKWLTESEAKIAEGYASAQRGELFGPGEVRSRLAELKRKRSSDRG